MTKEMWIEQHRDALEAEYDRMYRECVLANDEDLWDALHTYEAALIKLGLLEADTEEEPMDDDLNTSTNWDEIMLDMRIDLDRDERAAMAYEV